MLIKLEQKSPRSSSGVALLNLGFRPFFLLAGLSGSALVIYWSQIYLSGSQGLSYSSIEWHGHEMVFGYVAAVVAGFLLTAVKNWTGRQTFSGVALLALAVLWLAGRILPLATYVPVWLVSGIDFAFIPALAVSIALPIIKARNHRNLIFIGVLTIYAMANALFHLGMLGLLPDGQRMGNYSGLFIVLILISIMGGRVIPFFIERGLDSGVKTSKWLTIEISSALSLLALGILYVLGKNSWITSALALAAAVIHAIRLVGWYQHGIWRKPLLWVLVLAYAWIVLGLLLLSIAGLGSVPDMLAIHAMTVGGIGLVTAGMMVRVSMGHSGRLLHAPDALVLAFILLNLAAITRVFFPIAWPSHYLDAVIVSAWLWGIAFAIFVIRMAPVFWQPRVDGRPG